MVEEAEAPPPKVARRSRRGAPAAAEARFEPKFGPAEILSRLNSERASQRGAAPAERAQPNLFETARPGEMRRPLAPEAIPPAPRSEGTADLEGPRERTAASAVAPATEEPQAVSILKSGVIDGMAYTLFTDGSIEAQLPQGTLRFASIEELRIHLERGD